MIIGGLARGVAIGLFFIAGVAHAQNCVGRPDFDACMARIAGANQARLTQSQNALFAEYMRLYGPWVRKQYAAYRGPPMPFERFAYFMMMSANGTNVAGGLKAQQDQFAGQQRAQATRNEGYSDYRQGMYANSARTSRTAERYDQSAVRGNVAEIDPRTGQKHWLPYAQPDGQPFTQDGQTYVRDQNGYYQWTGNGWAPMRQGR